MNFKKIRKMFGGVWEGDGPGGSTIGLAFQAPLTTSIIPARGTGSPTFTRATTATVTDWESVVRYALSGEARFRGARRVRNWIVTNSENLTTWTGNNLTSSFGTFADPLGGQNATRGTSTTSVGQSRFVNSITGMGTTVGRTVTFSVWLRTLDAVPYTGCIAVGDGAAAEGTLNINLTSTWTRYSTTVTISAGTGHADALIYLNANADSGTSVTGRTLDVWGAQMEDVTGQSNTNPAEYVSIGVLSAPYHGAGVDAVQYFPTQNGNTVAAGVVTAGTGATIANSTLLGYLAEEARTNLALQSAAFDNASWTKGQLTITADAIASPDGTTTADKAAEQAISAEHVVIQSIATTAAAWTASVYVKQFGTTRPWVRVRIDDGGNTNGVQANYNVNTGALGQAATTVGAYSGASATITALPSGWYRLTLTATATAAAGARIVFYTMDQDYVTNVFTGNTVHAGDTAAGVYLWGAQAEAGAFATSYIPTTTAAATRNADVLTYPSSGNILGTAGTAYAEMTSVSTGTANERTILGASGGPTGPGILYSNNAATNPLSMGDNGTERSFAIGVNLPVSASLKVADKWAGTSANGYVAGVAGTPATFSGNLNLGATLYIGADDVGLRALNGTIRNVKIWTRVLADAEIASL